MVTEVKTDRELLRELLEEKQTRKKRRKFFDYYPDTGPLRRELYQKHLIGFDATRTHRQVWMMAGNRTGKTEGWLLYAITCAMTGEYPSWWTGRRWNRPVKVWLASTIGTKTRDILQFKLLGMPNALGTGVMPADNILNKTSKSGISEAIDSFYIQHKSGGVSVGQFKSYDQGRTAFEGTEQDIIGLDEEPPLPVYEEALVRTMTTQGSVWSSFTPLDGITELIANEFPEGRIHDGPTPSGKFIVSATWDDVPHLSEKDKDELWNSIAPHLRDSRKKGIPSVGAGLIYPVSEDDYVIDPFPIPDHWPKCYGFDVGWNNTAAVFMAKNPETGVKYLYDEHFKQKAEPVLHARAIETRGPWIPGLIDPAARGRSQVDGRKLLTEYREERLDLHLARNAREAGILKCWQGLTTGKTKVMASLMPNFMREIRMYRRDDDGQIIKNNDHCLDAWRYVEMDFDNIARVSPSYRNAHKKRRDPNYHYGGTDNNSWMGL